ncbi:MAG: hypothetical protein JW821_13190 [Deltaproteobacteria bacterium]|nr:hypothetical protein [Deltaproteobacteria bacterium]
MKRVHACKILLFVGILLGFLLGNPAGGACQDGSAALRIPEGVYIELTKDFYQALRDEGATGTRVYSNDPSAEYLKQISISARFMVETNLQILRQQEEVLRLLRSLLQDRKK